MIKSLIFLLFFLGSHSWAQLTDIARARNLMMRENPNFAVHHKVADLVANKTEILDYSRDLGHSNELNTVLLAFLYAAALPAKRETFEPPPGHAQYQELLDLIADQVYLINAINMILIVVNTCERRANQGTRPTIHMDNQEKLTEDTLGQGHGK